VVTQANSIAIALIGCPQMHSDFCRGIEILAAEPDSPQSKGETVENPVKLTSEDMEGISGVPKNVTKLKPVIDELMRKVITIAI